jgi:hypothetical protein
MADDDVYVIGCVHLWFGSFRSGAGYGTARGAATSHLIASVSWSHSHAIYKQVGRGDHSCSCMMHVHERLGLACATHRLPLPAAQDGGPGAAGQQEQGHSRANSYSTS